MSYSEKFEEIAESLSISKPRPIPLLGSVPPCTSASSLPYFQLVSSHGLHIGAFTWSLLYISYIHAISFMRGQVVVVVNSTTCTIVVNYYNHDIYAVQ